MKQRILVLGSGIAGLCSALSLSADGHDILILDRDGAPPPDLDHAFSGWRRPGVGHLRQSHAFLARLRNILLKDHPRLVEQMIEAGVRELKFDGMLTEIQRETYRARPQDEELTILTSRRTSLEYLIRRYVETLPNVAIRNGFFARRLLAERADDGVLRVTGLVGGPIDGPEEEMRGAVVDASGRLGICIEQLQRDGVPMIEESESAGVLYFTLHYRLRDGQSEPDRIGNPPPNGDLGFLKFGVFPGDNGRFSITLCLPEIEMEMRKAVVNPETFHRITQLLPGLAVWTNEARAERVSKVFGMGDLHSRWRNLSPEGNPSVYGYFPLGDTLIRTNPLYGRGCSFAAVGAEVVRAALAQRGDEAGKARFYFERIEKELRPYFENMRNQDRSAIRRAEAALTPDYKPSLKAKILKSFVEDGIAIAVRSDVELLREAMRGFHMLEHPDTWLKRPKNFGKVLYYWARGKRANAKAYPPKPGPERGEMLRILNVNPEADLVRKAA